MANFTRTGSLPPLNSTDSRYAVNITVNELVNGLFVENWLTQMNYSEYFKKCSPMLCSFTYVEQFNLMSTITYVLGLFGGLTLVLKWIIPKMVSVFRKTFQICAQQNHRVEPISRIQTTHIEIHVKSRTVTEPYVTLFSPTKLHLSFHLSRNTCSLKWFHYLMFYSIILVIAFIFILTPTIYLLKRREQSRWYSIVLQRFDYFQFISICLINDSREKWPWAFVTVKWESQWEGWNDHMLTNTVNSSQDGYTMKRMTCLQSIIGKT